MAFDHAADGGQKRRHVFAFEPLAAARIEHGFQFLDHERHIAATAEHGADHAGQRHGPGVMFHVLRIDEHLERAAAAILDDVVDGDVDRVIGIRPGDLIRLARQFPGPVERLRHIDHTA